MHHICFEVDDIETTLARLKAAGVPLIDEEPTIGAAGKKVAFVHPKGTGGVLVELCELTLEEPAKSGNG
jgi:methylmalonyl-CoA epimerase